jgi:outer membrane protein OmpA-like peptidoglycan-associated protein
VIGAVCVVLGSSAVPASAAKPNLANQSLTTPTSPKRVIPLTTTQVFPTGSLDSSEPSGMDPPTADALPGYSLTYENDFNGTTLPTGWDVYTGTPGNDSGTVLASSHVVVSKGLLQLNAFQDPAYNNEWVTGGVCQCGLAQDYGAYFVRSRVTGPGPTQVELLWPKVGWPPEIDFNESYGGDTSSTATVHYTSANQEDQRELSIDLTQWHTWGVIWTPQSITYTVDGSVWGTVTVASEIPDQPMTLDLQQQTFCAAGWACPTSPQSMLVDWVAEYSASIQYKVTVSPFAAKSPILSGAIKRQIQSLAETIKTNGYTAVTLLGYSDNQATAAKDLSASKQRASAVAAYLKQQLALLQVTGIIVSAVGNGRASPVSTGSTPASGAPRQRVVALIF